MAQHIEATLRIALARPIGYRVVYTVCYGEASAATGFTIPRTQLRDFLQHFTFAPEAIDRLIIRVDAGSTELLNIGHMDQEHAERILRSYAQW